MEKKWVLVTRDEEDGEDEEDEMVPIFVFNAHQHSLLLDDEVEKKERVVKKREEERVLTMSMGKGL